MLDKVSGNSALVITSLQNLISIFKIKCSGERMEGKTCFWAINPILFRYFSHEVTDWVVVSGGMLSSCTKSVTKELHKVAAKCLLPPFFSCAQKEAEDRAQQLILPRRSCEYWYLWWWWHVDTVLVFKMLFSKLLKQPDVGTVKSSTARFDFRTAFACGVWRVVCFISARLL